MNNARKINEMYLEHLFTIWIVFNLSYKENYTILCRESYEYDKN